MLVATSGCLTLPSLSDQLKISFELPPQSGMLLLQLLESSNASEI